MNKENYYKNLMETLQNLNKLRIQGKIMDLDKKIYLAAYKRDKMILNKKPRRYEK